MVASTIWNRDYPVKPMSYGLSLAAHGVLIALMWLMPAIPAPRLQERVLEEFKPQPGRRLVWYQFKKELPAVRPVQPSGPHPETRGLIRTLQQPIVAVSPRPISREQFVWNEAPKLEIREDLKAPNIVAPARPAPRAFRPPPAAAARKDPAVPALTGLPAELPKINDQPALAATPGALGRIDQPRRTFTMPSRGAGSSGTGTIALDAEAAPTVASDTAGATAGLAIIGLRPADRLDGPPPEGSRPGAFSRAASVGLPSTGKGSDSGLTVPDLMIAPGKTPPGAVAGRKSGAPGQRPEGELIYQETFAGGARTAMSTPLRPGVRNLPPAIEARFRTRLVYTIVVPMPKLPCYIGDWVMWFSEPQTASGGATPRMQAPIPVRKVDTLGSPGRQIEGAVRLFASLRKDGRLEGIETVSGDPALAELGIEDLKKWDFRPAFRDGAPVDVEIVFEIPLRLTAPSH